MESVVAGSAGTAKSKGVRKMSLTTYKQTGDLVDYVPGSNVSAGDIIVQVDLIGQVVADTASGARGALRIEGVINVPKLSSDVVAFGTVLYWDAGNSRATITASTHKLLGKAIAAAGNGVTRVDVKLCQQHKT
jgi:predicted RecA/RadA family phage recombinase